MATDDEFQNEYLDLSTDPDLGFAQLHRRKYRELEKIWEKDQGSDTHARREYVNSLFMYDRVMGTNVFSSLDHPPSGAKSFIEYFQMFLGHAEVAAHRFLIEAAQRKNASAQEVVLLDASARQSIRQLVESIKGKLDELDLPDNKREALFNQLNAFLAEVDRNRTRVEALYAFVVQSARVVKEAGEEFAPVQKTIDRILDKIDKAEKFYKRITSSDKPAELEGPPKQITDQNQNLDDEIPF